MASRNLAAYYFPTQVLLVDDNRRFLENLTACLKHAFKIDHTEDPHQAIERVRQNIALQRQTLQPLDELECFDETEQEFDAFSRRPISNAIDWQGMKGLRFQRDFISTLLVDYDMPKMDGVTLCRELKDLPLKKVILTGAGDYELAVNALNEHLIDGFVTKDITLDLDRLTTLINELQINYFADQHGRFTSQLPNYKYDSANRLDYLNLVEHILQEGRIQQYYLIDAMGSYLFIDNKGREKWLIIRCEEQLEMYYELAYHANASQRLIKALQTRRWFPCLITEAHAREPVHQWHRFLQPIQPFSKDPRYYYAIVE